MKISNKNLRMKLTRISMHTHTHSHTYTYTHNQMVSKFSNVVLKFGYAYNELIHSHTTTPHPPNQHHSLSNYSSLSQTPPNPQSPIPKPTKTWGRAIIVCVAIPLPPFGQGGSGCRESMISWLKELM